MSKDNKRCACGSGRKYKNCCKNKKKRVIEFDLHPSNVENIEGIAISDKGELLKIVNGIRMPFSGSTILRYGYDRDSGKRKILTEGVIHDGKCYLNPNHPILNFHQI